MRIGFLPNDLMNVVPIQTLDLNTNDLRGTVPTLIGQLSSLTYLDVSYNAFSGYLPSALCGLINLKNLIVCGSKSSKVGCPDLSGYPECLLSLNAVDQLGNLSIISTPTSPTSSPSRIFGVHGISSNSLMFFRSGYGIAVVVTALFVLIFCGFVLVRKGLTKCSTHVEYDNVDEQSLGELVRSENSSISTSMTLRRQEQQEFRV